MHPDRNTAANNATARRNIAPPDFVPERSKQNRLRVATPHFPYLGETGQAADSVSISVRSAGIAWRLPEVAQPDVAVLEQPSAALAVVAQPSAAEVAAERSPAVAVVTARPSAAQAVVVVRTHAAAAVAHSRVVVVAAVTASQSEAQR
jgi:hypothetical protein